MDADTTSQEERRQASRGESDGSRDGVAEPDLSLFLAAFRLARFYALLSPGILQRELGVDRATAERLIERLAEAGALGPVFVERTGARESLVNMVNDVPAQQFTLGPAPAHSPLTDRAAIVATLVGVVLGVGVAAGLILSGLGQRAVSTLGLAATSPALADLSGAFLLPLAIGGALAGLVDRLLTPPEAPSYGTARVRQALWTLFATVTTGIAATQFLR